MHIEGDTIMFKSIARIFNKEKDGRKPNTVRRTENADENARIFSFALSFEEGTQKYIEIEGTKTGEKFTRAITDITPFDDIWIFSWLHPTGGLAAKGGDA